MCDIFGIVISLVYTCLLLQPSLQIKGLRRGRTTARPHGTGRVLDAESCREGVKSSENDGTASGSDWKAIQYAERAWKVVKELG